MKKIAELLENIFSLIIIISLICIYLYGGYILSAIGIAIAAVAIPVFIAGLFLAYVFHAVKDLFLGK